MKLIRRGLVGFMGAIVLLGSSAGFGGMALASEAVIPGMSQAEEKLEVRKKCCSYKWVHMLSRDEKLMSLLKMDQQTFMRKLAEGKSLAQIAEEQNVSRKQLKKALAQSFDKKMAQKKKWFAERLDQMIDKNLSDSNRSMPNDDAAGNR